MAIRIDPRHLYLQVIDRIKQDIEEGVYKENEKLPSEFQLAKRLGVSRATLREALRILEEENIVTRRHGVGTFVNQKPIFTSGIEQLTSVTNMIEAAGKIPGTQFLSTDLVSPQEEEIQKFSSILKEKLIKIERVRTADGKPVVFCVDKIPSEFIPLDFIHKEGSLFDLLEEYANKRIEYAVAYIEPTIYHERIYEILDCEPDQALLVLKQVHYTADDEPVLYSVNYFRPDVFSFHVLRKRV